MKTRTLIAIAFSISLAIGIGLGGALFLDHGEDQGSDEISPKLLKRFQKSVKARADRGWQSPQPRPKATGQKSETQQSGIVKLIAEVKSLSSAALPSKDVRQDYQKLMGSSAKLNQAKEALLSIPKEGARIAARNQRMSLVNYLTDALAWQDNPARSEVLDIITTVLLSENFRHKGLSHAVKKDLVGDKIELYFALYMHEPDQARALVRSGDHLPNSKTLAYAHRLAVNLDKEPTVYDPKGGGSL